MKAKTVGTSLVVQWLRLCAPNAGGPGLISGQGTKIPHAATKSPHAATKKKKIPYMAMKIARAATKTCAAK